MPNNFKLFELRYPKFKLASHLRILYFLIYISWELEGGLLFGVSKYCKLLQEDRPLFVQFCANDPDTLLDAARRVEPFCDYVDINLG